MGDILFVTSFILGILFAILGFGRHHYYFWLAGLLFYFTSFLGSFSIGLYMLILPIWLWLFAIARALHWIKKPWHYLYFILIGAVLWYVAVTYIDDYYLFYPFS
jgi:hypothetical protein